LDSNPDIQKQARAKKVLPSISKRITQHMKDKNITGEIIVPETNWCFSITPKTEKAGLSYELMKVAFVHYCTSKGYAIKQGESDAFVDCIKETQRVKEATDVQLLAIKREFI